MVDDNIVIGGDNGSTKKSTFLKYNEIPLKSFSDHSSNHWKEFTIESPVGSYSGSNINKFESTPYRSGGFNYKSTSGSTSTSNIKTEGRFIIWRLVNDSTVLELSEHYTHHSLLGNQIKIHFNNTNIIGDVFIQEYTDKHVIIMLTTSSKSIYRFILPHPNEIEKNESRVGIKRKQVLDQGGEKRFKSIFSNLLNSQLDNQWSRVRGVLPESFEPTVIRYYSPTKLIVGSSNSGSTWIELSDVKQNGDLTSRKYDCREGQGFFSSWKWGEKQESVADIQLFNNNSNSSTGYPLAFILLSNSQLRVWSANDKKYIKDQIILPESWNTENNNNNNNNNNNIPTSPNSNQQQSSLLSSTHKRFKIYPKSNTNFKMVIYFQHEFESNFQFYSGSIDFNGSGSDNNGVKYNISFEVERFSFLKSRGLIDFNVSNGYLYTLWNQDKVIEMKQQQQQKDQDSEFTDYDSEYDQQQQYQQQQQEKELILKHIYIGDIADSGEINLEYNQFYSSTMNHFYDKVYESPIEHQDETDQSFYSNLLFSSGNFSQSSIESALNEYKKEKDLDDDDEMLPEFNSLELIVKTILNQEDQKYQSNDQWSIFYKLCIKYQKQLSLSASGLFIESSSSIIFLIRQNQLSIMKPMTALESLFSNGIEDQLEQSHFESLFYGLFGVAAIESNSNGVVQDFINIMKCCNYIERYVHESGDDFRSFEYELSRQPISFAVRKEAERLITTQVGDKDAYSIGFIKLFKSIQEPNGSIDLLLSQFTKEFNNHNNCNITIAIASSGNSSKNWKLWNGDLFTDILDNSFKSSIQIRYRIVSSLSLLLGTISNLRSQLNISSKLVFEFEKTTFPQSISILSTYYLLNWFTKQNLIKNDKSEIDLLNVNNGDNGGNGNLAADEDDIDIGYQQQQQQQVSNLLSNLINNHSIQFSGKIGKNEFFENVEIQTLKLLCILAPKMDIFSMGCYLVEKNQYKQLNQLLTILTNNEMISGISAESSEVTSSSGSTPFYYLMGICNAHYSRFNQAYQYLIKATESIESENQDMIKICLISKEELVVNLFVDVPLSPPYHSKKSLIVNYYLKCIKIFETRNQPEFIIQFSLFAIEYLNKNDSNGNNGDGTQDTIECKNKFELLYSLVFKYSLKIKKYDLAFTASIENPNSNVSNDNKKRLILTLCENGDIKDLCQLPFSPSDVESVLGKLVIAQEHLSKKPEYHTILFAYYISRCNYRSAAKLCYESSTKLKIEGLGKSRGKSIYDQLTILNSKLDLYSTTINTLKLLDTSNQWIQFNGNLLNYLKFTNNNQYQPLHQQQQQQPNNETSIITLKEIEKSYSYYLATKHLISIGVTSNSDFLLSPDQLLNELVENSLYDTAFSLAITQEINLGSIFNSFALKCVGFQLNPNLNPFLTKSNVGGTGNGQFGFDQSKFQYFKDPIEISWKVLESYLKRYDSNQDLQCLSPSMINQSITDNKQQSQIEISTGQQKQLKMIGTVKCDSLQQRECGGCTFKVVDEKGFYLDVFYDKRSPPFLKSNDQVIAIGKMNSDGRFIADEILCKNGQSRYHEVVAETILYQNCIDLPNWLVQWFLNGRQESLFKLYFKHSRLLDACRALTSLFNTAISQLEQQYQHHQTLLNIPYDIIDRFFIESFKILKSNQITSTTEKLQFENSLNSLKSLISKYLNKL